MAIVDVNGKKMARKVFAKAAILSSEDGDDWEILKPDQVPEWLKDADIMAHLMDGEVVSVEEGGPYFYAERSN